MRQSKNAFPIVDTKERAEMDYLKNNLWNWSFIQQHQAQHHQNQINQIFDCTKKLKDFLDSTDKIDPAYQQMAMAQMCAVLLEHFQNNTGRI